MPDRFGPRGVFAVLIPLQNANMQPEYESMRPAGVSNQIYRFDISNHGSADQAVAGAVAGALGCWPDMIICGNSVEMQGWSRAQQEDYDARLSAKSNGVPIFTATEACAAGLRAVGAKRIGLLSPMSEPGSQSAKRYYEELGFDVVSDTWLGVTKSENIIKVTPDEIKTAMERIAVEGVDTILHVGSALGLVGMIAELETQFDRPVISPNAAAYWYALRKHGIDDVSPDFGRLHTIQGLPDGG